MRIPAMAPVAPWIFTHVAPLESRTAQGMNLVGSPSLLLYLYGSAFVRTNLRTLRLNGEPAQITYDCAVPE